MTALGGNSDRARDKEHDEELFGFIEKFSAVLIAGGFPPMPARVFAALHVADSGRLTAAELVDILQISPAAVSGAVRYLSGLNLLLRERVPGSRREHYRMPADIWQRVMRSQTQILHQWVALLKEGTDLVGPDTQAGQRMAGHAGFFAFLTTEIPAVYARWEEQKDLVNVVIMRYLVQEKMFSIGDDFWITDQHGNRVFLADGKALTLRDAFELKDAQGQLLTRIHKKLLSMRDTREIEDGRGVIARVRPAFFSPIRHRYEIELADGERMEAVGNFTDKDWELVGGDGRLVGRISRKWFRMRDAYGVEVAPGEDEPLVISIAVCIDRIHEEEVHKNHQNLLYGTPHGTC